MSTTPYVEATSADPFVRELHRRAMRLLNDPSLDRRKREFHMRQLQSILLEHQSKQEAKTAKREQVSRSNRNQGVADQSQVLARRREFERGVETAVAAVEAVASSSVLRAVTQASAAANASQLTRRSRPVLTLKRA